MARAVWYAVVLCWLAISANAAGYDDLMRGLALNNAGNFDKAIEAFGAALKAGDLAETYTPSAYFGRATAYASTNQCALAEADLDNALKLRPAYLQAIILRANIRDCQNKYEDARADFGAAIKLSPSTELYRARGQFYWRHAEYASAATDFLKSSDLAPKNDYYSAKRGYVLIWYAISAARAGSLQVPDFAKQVDDADVDGWPEPILDFFVGSMKTEEVYAKAARGDGVLPAQQKCEADFYLGEWQIGHNDPSGKSRIQQAEAGCPHNFIEYFAAQTELKRLP